jgi:hypothetical protein
VAIAPSTFLTRCYGFEARVADAKRAKSEWNSRIQVEFSLFATSYTTAASG